MDRPTRMLAGLVLGLAGQLGEHRRDWVHALLAETDDQPAGPARLAWLGGGLWLVTREVLMNRIIQALAFAAGAVGLVWIAWPGASTNSATPVNRMYVVGILVLLAGLPLLVRRYFGPARPGWAPLVTRVGGYAVVLALIAATAVQQRIGSQLGEFFPVIGPVWAMNVGFLLIIAGYVAALLILTSRRVQFTHRVLPLALGIGALTAGVLYPLAPFGIGAMAEATSHSLHGGPAVVADYLLLACFSMAALAVPVAVHAMATRLADRDTRPGLLTPSRQALLATGAAMATAAILVALFTSITIALLPHQVPRQLGDGICPTCDPSTVVIPANLRQEYYFEESVGGAGDGASALWFVPLSSASPWVPCAVTSATTHRPPPDPRASPRARNATQEREQGGQLLERPGYASGAEHRGGWVPAGAGAGPRVQSSAGTPQAFHPDPGADQAADLPELPLPASASIVRRNPSTLLGCRPADGSSST